jgi:thioesterase domain-containing protein
MGHPLIDLPTAKNGALKPLNDEVFVFPATVGQQGFWYLDQIDPGNPAYNIAVRFRLEGTMQYAALFYAINEIVRRHETLRTVVMDIDGQPVQVVTPSLRIDVPVIDLGDVPAAERHARSELLTVEEARRRFNLSSGPLIRASLLRLNEQDHVLLVTVHHVISDGWSIGLITNELGTLYDAYCQGLKSPLADLSLQYGDFAVWQKRHLESRDLQSQLLYWRGKLSHLPVLEIRTDRPRPAIQTSNGHIESILLPTPLTESLKEISNREGVTFFMLALAALKVLLSRHSNQTDIFVGTLVAGRSRVELEPLIGLFINPLVLRTDLSGNPTFRELLARVRGTVVEALSNQDVPFERVVEVVHSKRDPSRHPVFQINFIYQRDFVKPLQVSGLTLTAIPSKSPGAIYDLNFFMVERADGWRASCEYNTDLYEAASINRLLAQFQALLEGIVADPSTRISEIPMLTTKNRESWMEAVTGPIRRPVVRVPHRAAAGPGSFMGPRDEMEARLVKLWEQLLGFNGISVTADFFDEGGHSLLVARLLAQTERTFSRKVPLATFLQSPTIQGVAKFLREEKSDDHVGRALALQPDGSRSPLFLVDAGPFFLPLTRRLGKDQPVYSLLLPELVDLPKDFTAKEIVEYLIASLREMCPHGPYHLGGWSHAGVLAYEMAQRLKSEGEDVALVILFDTCNPRYLRRFKGLKALPVRLYLRGTKLLYHLGTIRRMKLTEAIEYSRDRLKTIQEGWKVAFWRFWYRQMKRPAPQHLNVSSSFFYLAVEDCELEPTTVPIAFFRSEVLRTGRFRDPLLGWGPLARGGFRLHALPGDHATMFIEPVVQQLCEKLAESLSQTTKTARIS